MVRADLFSGSLAVWNSLNGTIRIFCPPDPSPPQAGEDRIPFELFLEYTAIQDFASGKMMSRGAKRAAQLGFERVFVAKKKMIYQ
ncbi:MAG: hypothetical protein Q8L47_02100 [bacterium]|nr:hypothetical protein [bacterium]